MPIDPTHHHFQDLSPQMKNLPPVETYFAEFFFFFGGGGGGGTFCPPFLPVDRILKYLPTTLKGRMFIQYACFCAFVSILNTKKQNIHVSIKIAYFSPNYPKS